MDYGQTKKPSDSQSFFTAGVGDLPEEQNTFESENNLNLDNSGASWAPSRDPRNIGSRAIFSAPEPVPSLENEKNVSAEPGMTLVEKPDLPTDIELAPPEMNGLPEMPNFTPAAAPTLDPVKEVPFDETAIKTEGDHVNHATLTEIDKTIAKLDHTGNAADFYAAIRGDDTHPGMVRNNLKNSFGRDVAWVSNGWAS